MLLHLLHILQRITVHYLHLSLSLSIFVSLSLTTCMPPLALAKLLRFAAGVGVAGAGSVAVVVCWLVERRSCKLEMAISIDSIGKLLLCEKVAKLLVAYVFKPNLASFSEFLLFSCHI